MQARKRFEMRTRPRLAGTKELCSRLGICRSYLYSITRGKMKPSAALARRMRRLGVEVPAKEGGAE